MEVGAIEICRVEDAPSKKTKIEWRIDDFFAVIEKDDTLGFFCQSPSFAYVDSIWNFRLWPNSHNNLIKVTFWSALELEESVSYIIGLKKHNGWVDRKIYGRIDSDERHSGRNGLIQPTELERRKHVYAPGNVLTISCTLELFDRISNAAQPSSSVPSKTKSPELIASPGTPITFCPPTGSDTLMKAGVCTTISTRFQHINVMEKYEDKSVETLSLEKSFPTDASTQTEELHVSKLLQALKEMLLSSKHSDFILNVQGKELKAHKIILAAHSPVFAAMLEHDTKEKATGIVDIDDFEPLTITNFLEFLYTRKIENLNSDDALHLYEVANKYQVTELSDLCLKHIINNISIDNFCDIFTFSLRHHVRDLTEVATQFFLQNSTEIAVTSKWITFLAENPVAGNELFLKFLNLKK